MVMEMKIYRYGQKGVDDENRGRASEMLARCLFEAEVEGMVVDNGRRRRKNVMGSLLIPRV